MSDVFPNRRVYESWLKKDNTPIFSREVIRDAQTRVQKLPDLIMRAQCTRTLMKQAAPASDPCCQDPGPVVENTPSSNGSLPWNGCESMEIAPAGKEIDDVTSADLNDDVIPPGPLQISPGQLDLVARRLRQCAETLYLYRDPRPARSLCVMLLDKLRKTHRIAASRGFALLENRDEAQRSQQKLQTQIDELESRLEDQRRDSRKIQQRIRRDLPEEVQTSETQTEIETPISTCSQAVQTCPDEDIFYDAVSTIDSPEEIFYDALSTLDNSEDPSTSSIATLDDLINLANSDLDNAGKGMEDLTMLKASKAAEGTIVRSKEDLVPWQESGRDVILGSGATATVYLHRHARTNEPVALKVIAIPSDSSIGDEYEKRVVPLKKLEKEIEILKSLGWVDFFPEFYGCVRFDQDKIGIAMEFCGDEAKGESYSILNCMDDKGPKLDKEDWLKVMLDVGDGLDMMHRSGYLCNDLKEDNVMVVKCEGEWRAMIIDFGGSCNINKPAKVDLSVLQKDAYMLRQQYNYMAPECALAGGRFSVQSDVYSLGRLAAFLGEKMGLKELEDYGSSIRKYEPMERPTLEKFTEEISYLRCGTFKMDDDEHSRGISQESSEDVTKRTQNAQTNTVLKTGVLKRFLEITTPHTSQ